MGSNDMNAETLTALKGSIQKWKDIEAGTGVDKGRYNCPLCNLFNILFTCEGCPVYLKTKKSGCADSPYDEWVIHQDWNHDGSFPHKVKCPTCLELATAEREFLESLLPSEESQ